MNIYLRGLSSATLSPLLIDSLQVTRKDPCSVHFPGIRSSISVQRVSPAEAARKKSQRTSIFVLDQPTAAKSKLKLEDFKMLKVLGKGSFGKVR